jgi:ABC-2 type transporter
MNATPGGVLSRRSHAQFAALLKVQARLSLREPYGLGLGVGLPAVLLVVFGFISKNVPGNVGGSGLTVINLYVPTLMFISFMAITISLPNSLEKDREIGWLRRISTTSVHPSRLLAAQLILNLLFAVAAIVIVIASGQVIFGAPLGDIMWYSPTGAAVRAILYSVFHAAPPLTTLLTLVGYTLVLRSLPSATSAGNSLIGANG